MSEPTQNTSLPRSWQFYPQSQIIGTSPHPQYRGEAYALGDGLADRLNKYENENQDLLDSLSYAVSENVMLETELSKKTAEVERLREALEPFARYAIRHGSADLCGIGGAFLKKEDWQKAIAVIFAPAKEEPVTQDSRITEPAAAPTDLNQPIKEDAVALSEPRDLLDDEEIQEGDHGQRVFQDERLKVWWKVDEEHIGTIAGSWKSVRFRTRRPLPKKEVTTSVSVNEPGEFTWQKDVRDLTLAIRELSNEMQKLQQ